MKELVSSTLKFAGLFTILLLIHSCSNDKKEQSQVHTHDGSTHTHDATKETFSLKSLVNEAKQTPDSIIAALNAQHHQFKVLERRAVPGPFTSSE